MSRAMSMLLQVLISGIVLLLPNNCRCYVRTTAIFRSTSGCVLQFTHTPCLWATINCSQCCVHGQQWLPKWHPCEGSPGGCRCTSNTHASHHRVPQLCQPSPSLQSGTKWTVRHHHRNVCLCSHHSRVWELVILSKCLHNNQWRLLFSNCTCW
jgi:hypothetical protein